MVQHKHCLPILFTPSPTLRYSGRSDLSQACLCPSLISPCPRRPEQTPAHTTPPDQRVLQGLSSLGVGVRSHFTNRTEHLRPNTAYCRQGELQKTGLKDRAAWTQQNVLCTHWRHSLKCQTLSATWPLLYKVITFRSRRHRWLF